MTDFMTLKFRRRNDKNTGSGTAISVHDRALVLINILQTFYSGNFGDEKRFQIVNGQLHIQGYLRFYFHAPLSATMIQIFLHFVNLSLRKEKNALRGDHVCLPLRLSVAYYLRQNYSSDFHEISRVS
jgi:hypothetical protein